MRLLFMFVCSGVAATVFAAESRAQDCAASSKDVPIESLLATADSWPNLRNSPGSLRYESSRMLKEAANNLAGAKPPADACPAGCAAAGKPTIVYLTIPNKYLTGYSDQKKCDAYFAKTKTAPFQYNGRQFGSIDDLASWFGDFSKGDGKDGNDLYAKCDGSCSPQYHTTIVPNAAGYSLDAAVVCGAARDKGDNKYNLSIAYHWPCVSGTGQ